ncbi:MAG TPA: calcium-binding protein [Allosphingosinicella sp.]|nr:calcium-binding protein [Allosphingosinicella sp.]
MPIINGTPNDDVLVGTSEHDELYGLDGNDILDGGGGGDRMDGGAGDDIYIIRHADDFINEGRHGNFGNDIVYVTLSYTVSSFIDNTSFETVSTIQHNATDDINITSFYTQTQTMIGNYGNNILSGAYKTYIGFFGNDTFYVWSDQFPDVSIIENGGEGNDIVRLFGSSGGYVLNDGASVETMTIDDLNSTTALSLTGNDLTQTIIGNKGNNSLDGGSGGNDILIGGDGNDTYHVRRSGLTLTETATGGTADKIIAYLDFDLRTVTNIEDLQAATGTAPINLLGNEFANRLTGNDGNNILNGGAGAADIMVGGLGDDIYRINQAGDSVLETVNAGTDTIYVHFSYSIEAFTHVENLSAADQIGTESLNFTGNGQHNIIVGNYGANILDGTSGGEDTLYGLVGNDTYVIRSSGDHPVEQVGQGSDTAYAYLSWTLQAGTEVEVVSTVSHAATTAIDLTGNEFGQTVVGNAGANVLDGKGGNDLLAGLGGADTFAFTSALGAGNVDTIFDFSAADDTIALDDAVFTGLTPGALPAGAFVTGAAAQDLDDRIIYNQATGQLFYDADGSGAGAAVHFATLSGAPAITAADFMVI